MSKRKVHKVLRYSQPVALTLCGKWQDDYVPWLEVTEDPGEVTCLKCKVELFKQGLLKGGE